MKLMIREMYREEYPVLEEFLYQAIFVPEGAEPPTRDIIEMPELQMYIADFGEKEADLCLVAVAAGHIVGSAWTRIMNDYGHVDEDTPSLFLSVLREYRGLGIGTLLMEKMLDLLKRKGMPGSPYPYKKPITQRGCTRRWGFKCFWRTKKTW